MYLYLYIHGASWTFKHPLSIFKDGTYDLTTVVGWLRLKWRINTAEPPAKQKMIAPNEEETLMKRHQFSHARRKQRLVKDRGMDFFP